MNQIIQKFFAFMDDITSKDKIIKTLAVVIGAGVLIYIFPPFAFLGFVLLIVYYIYGHN